MKVLNTQYAKLVSQARGLYKDYKKMRMEIADLCIKACTIRHGGRSGDLYTMKEFCNDTGINRKTLSKWVQDRKIQITMQK